MHCCVFGSLFNGCCEVLEALRRTVLITPSVPNFVGSSSFIQHTTHPELLYVILQPAAADVGSQRTVAVTNAGSFTILCRKDLGLCCRCRYRRTCDAVGPAAVRNAMLRDLLKVSTSRAPRALEDTALPGYLE